MAKRRWDATGLAHLEVGEVMGKKVWTVPPETPVAALVKLFEDKGYHHALVARDGTLEGVVSERDLLRLLRRDRWRAGAFGVTAAEVMSGDVVTVGPKTKLPAAVIKMLETAAPCLAVVEGRERRLVGILTATDFLDVLLGLTLDDFVHG
jgi:CBS domain-containing protein